MTYQAVLRRTLFRMGGGDAETAHERTVKALARLGSARPAVAAGVKVFGTADPVRVCGIRFANRVGLAAGMDKDGRALRAWPALGFGFVEVGTVTRHAQPGNPRPRLYRLPGSAAIVNRMGFNNAGADALAERLKALGPLGFPLGISIGKSKVTPIGEAISDYAYSLRALYPYGDYFAVNVSSPNTPGLRGLQDSAALDGLLAALRAQIEELRGNGKPTPLLVKIAPDLSDDAILELLDVLAAHRIDGVIATNTTLSRNGIDPSETRIGEQQGGLSGRPLGTRAVEVVRLVSQHTKGKLPIIGVGGIDSVAQASRMFEAGASLVQLYTGFIYGGPQLVRAVARSARGVDSAAAR